MSATAVEPLQITIEASALRDWIERLAKIADPAIRYHEDHSIMQMWVIEKSRYEAKELADEIEKRLPPYLGRYASVQVEVKDV